jgi:hypothetical protein
MSIVLSEEFGQVEDVKYNISIQISFYLLLCIGVQPDPSYDGKNLRWKKL